MTPLLLLLGIALAHPLGSDAWSLRAGLHLRESQALALVVGEIPIAVVARDLRSRAQDGPVTRATVDAYTRERQQQLIDGMTVMIDGETVGAKWLAAPSSANGKAIDGFFVYAIVATLPLSAGATVEIALRNDAWQQEELVFFGEVRADDPFGAVRHDAPSEWTRDPRARRLWVRAQRATLGRESAEGTGGGKER